APAALRRPAPRPLAGRAPRRRRPAVESGHRHGADGADPGRPGPGRPLAMVATRAAPAGPRPGGLAGQRRAGPHGGRLARAALARAMTAPAAPARLSLRAAAGIVLALWVPYAALNAVFPGPRLTYGLGLLIAALALGALRLAGVPPRQC